MKSEASILYSGGTDSALAAVKMLENHEKVTLLTFNPGFILFIENSRKHAEKLKKHYGPSRVNHIILNIKNIFKAIFLSDIKKDLKKYGPHLMVQLCHGCRIAMHTQAIIYNLEHGVKYIADGSTKKQSAIPEQMRFILKENKKFYATKYGIIHSSPIYHIDRSDLELSKAGLAFKNNLKEQFVFYDTQSTCPFGVPADVYARIFYKKLNPDYEQECREYNKEKHKKMDEYIKNYFNKKKKNLNKLISNLKKKQ